MPSSQPMSALESLRTVEFRQTLRGYHIDDVDEYLERVAVEADGLQEQLRQSADRLRQATDRIVALESQQRDGPPAVPSSPAVSDDTLQRTLLMAQKFVEQTEAEAKAQARTVMEEARQRAQEMLSEAEEGARSASAESEKRLREEVARLEGLRTKLAGDVEAITRYLDTERSRLRGALGEMLHWIDEKMQPSAGVKPPAAETRTSAPESRPTSPGSRAAGSESEPGGPVARQREEVGVAAAAGTSRSSLQAITQTNTPNGASR